MKFKNLFLRFSRKTDYYFNPYRFFSQSANSQIEYLMIPNHQEKTTHLALLPLQPSNPNIGAHMTLT